MARISVNRAVSTRLLKLRKTVEVDISMPSVKMPAGTDEICDRWRYIRAVYYDYTGTKGNG